MQQYQRDRRVRQAAAFVAAASFATPAFAYVDPGTGTMLLQVLGAVVAGVVFYFHELKRKLRALLSRREAAADEDKPGPGDAVP